MRNLLLTIFSIWSFSVSAQQIDAKQLFAAASKQALSNVSKEACQCIDSISAYNKSSAEIAAEIGKCIDKQVVAYQLIKKLAEDDKQKGKKKKQTINVELSSDKNSNEYKSYYFEIERHLMDSCSAIKQKVAANDKQGDNSVSNNPEARALYTKGTDEVNAKNYSAGIEDLKAALKIDSVFAFAWDVLGVAYRRSGQLDKALAAYRKSIELNPKGFVPWQNTAFVYQAQKEYNKAIEAYQKLAELDKNNPEVYYGLGRIYAFNLGELEKGLHQMCIAYNLYVEQQSPYRTDAEKVINEIFSEMKKQGNEKRFNEILKEHNINRK